MGGHHGITANFIKCMQGWYTHIIETNDTVNGMLHDFEALTDHSCSTDENPMHTKCPPHRPSHDENYKSYCFIKRYQWRKACEARKYLEMETIQLL